METGSVTRLSATVLAIVAILVIGTLSCASAALTVTTDHPGNLFTVGESVSFTVSGNSGDVSWVVGDWKDQQRASGTSAQATISLKPLPPGYYEIKCSDAAGGVVVPFGVVMNRGAKPSDKEGRIGIDAALAWCVEDKQVPEAAKIVSVAGIPWVRERLAWGEVEKEPGKIDWRGYERVANTHQALGTSVTQVVDFAPWWANDNNSPNPPPRDLAGVYKFFRLAGKHFAGRIQAWEPWNEVDNGWPALADTYSSVLKAASLGIRDGDPTALMLPASFSAHWKVPFQDNLAECGVADHFDVTNYHRYHDPYGQQPTVRELVKIYGRKPVWLTETNLLFWPKEGPDGKLLGRAEQQRGARYIPRAAALSLAAGIQRMFIFMLPHRPEGDVQFGLLRPDLTPYPEFIALSAVANILGHSTYLGTYPSPKGTDARAFSTPEGNAVVAWSNEPTKSVLRVRGKVIRVLDVFGSDKGIQSQNGIAVVELSEEPVYILGASLDGVTPAKHVTAINTVPSRVTQSKIVLAPRCDLSIAKRHNWYLIPSGQPVNYTVQVWNLDDSKNAKGIVTLRVPKGWSADKTRFDVNIAPMSHESVLVKLTPDTTKLGPEKLRVDATFNGRRVSPLVSWFGRDPAAVKPARSMRLAKDDSGWQVVSIGAQTASVEKFENGVFRIKALPGAPDSRSATLKLSSAKGFRLDSYDGLIVTAPVEPASTKADLRLRLTDARGAVWECGASEGCAPGSPVFLFQDLEWQWWSVPAFVPSLRGAKTVELICSFEKPVEEFTLRLGKVDAVKYP